MNGKLCVRVGILLLLAVIDAFGETKKTKQHIDRSSLFEALDNGGSVYLCAISSHESIASRSNRSVENGKITLSVSRTLLGPTRKTLTLPYACATGKARFYYTWPPITEIGGRPLICVVNTGPGDGSEPTLEGIDESASIVKVLANATDPKIEEFDAICKLHEQVQTRNVASALRAALNDNRFDFRNFSLQAIVSKLGKEDPDGALALLKSQAENWTDSADTKREAKGLVVYIERRIGMEEPMVETSRFLARCLAVLATSPSPNLRECAVSSLAIRLPFMNSQAKFGLLSDLPAAEKAKLIEILTKEAPVNPNARVILSQLAR